MKKPWVLSYTSSASEDSDRTGRIPRLIWVFAGRTLILLVLSCRGSYLILSTTHMTYEPQHDKTYKMACAPRETQSDQSPTTKNPNAEGAYPEYIHLCSLQCSNRQRTLNLGLVSSKYSAPKEPTSNHNCPYWMPCSWIDAGAVNMNIPNYKGIQTISLPSDPYYLYTHVYGQICVWFTHLFCLLMFCVFRQGKNSESHFTILHHKVLQNLSRCDCVHRFFALFRSLIEMWT